MRAALLLVVALAIAEPASRAQAQIYPSLVETDHTADIVAFATPVQASETPGIPPNLTLTIQLLLDRILKGRPASTTILATIAERYYFG